jgi:DNA-binding transcriptional regulator/RsmH inhibitor MraZ
LVVPEDFCGALKLAGEVVLAGAIESFEIWNPGAWADAKAKVEAVAVQHLASFGL